MNPVTPIDNSSPHAGRIQGDPWQAYAAVLEGIHRESPGIWTYRIRFQDSSVAADYSAKPGQFNMLYLPGIGEAAISLSGRSLADEPLIHTVRAVGNVTRALADAKVGFSLGIRGPFGSHWPLEQCMGKDVIVVAGGIGLAPLRPAIYEMMANRERFGRVSVLIGARSPADLLYHEEYANWEAAAIDVETTVDRAERDWAGNVGVVTLLINRLGILDSRQTVMLSCGPEVMMRYAIQAVRERGVPRTNLWLSLERNMNCAIGHCGHCQLGPHFICKDGPVLRYDQVADIMRVDSL